MLGRCGAERKRTYREVTLDFENVRFVNDLGVGVLTIDRPAAMNALDAATLDGIEHAVDAAVAERCAGLVVTGSGKAFVAGADIAGMRSMTESEAAAFGRRGNDLFARLEALPIPVIAAVNGFALGGGCELAMACDFIYAVERAKFGQPEVGLGLIAGFGGTQRLPRRIPYGAAMELLLTGRMIDAAEAHRLGLVTRICPADDLLAQAVATLREIASKGPVAVRETKRLAGLTQAALAEGLAAEIATFGAIFATEDRTEGLAAFLEKRPAVFHGK